MRAPAPSALEHPEHPAEQDEPARDEEDRPDGYELMELFRRQMG